MDTTLFLAKVVGIALIVIGAVVGLRRRYLVPVFRGYVDQPLLRVTMSMIELLAGPPSSFTMRGRPCRRPS